MYDNYIWFFGDKSAKKSADLAQTRNRELYYRYHLKGALFNFVSIAGIFLAGLHFRWSVPLIVGLWSMPFLISAVWGFISAKALATRFPEKYCNVAASIRAKAKRHLRMAAIIIALVALTVVGVIK